MSFRQEEQARMAAKATTERYGIGRPRIICALPVQEGPFSVQGTIGAGKSPA
jgi:hypothetical protein